MAEQSQIVIQINHWDRYFNSPNDLAPA